MKITGKIGLALLVIGFLGLIVPGLEAATIRVNCNRGDSVQSALDSLTGPATLVVTGTCHENIVIKKDDVTIQGGTFVGRDPNQNTIQVTAARRALITGATVGGARNGVVSFQGGSVTVENSIIQDNGKAGISANFGSSAIVKFCTIRDNSLQGVVVTDNSALVLINSTVTANGGTGVLAQRSSSARIGQNLLSEAGPNTITNNTGNGVSITRSAYAIIDNNTITGNSSHGVNVEGASATVTNNTIAKNQSKGILVHNSGNARIGITEGDQPGSNTIEKNVYEGIEISNSAAAYMLANTIKLNGLTNYRPGVKIYQATGRLIGGNTIEGNGGHGVEVDMGALLQGLGDWNLNTQPDKISDNNSSGIYAWNGSSLSIQKAEITQNTEHGIGVSLRSTVRIYDSTVSDNKKHGIWLWRGSAVILSLDANTPPASVTGNKLWGVLCEDTESSYSGDPSGVTGNTSGNVSPSCTPF
jgi:parallel beta-helix repeat protein